MSSIHKLPQGSFIDPSGKNESTIRALIEKAVNIIVGEAVSADQRPPLPDFKKRLWQPTEFPEAPVAEEGILENLKILIREAMNPANLGYMGHMDPPPMTMSIIGDLIASSLNNNMLCFEMAPSFTVLEKALLKHIAHLFGLGEHSGGIMVSGGSLGNLAVISLARNTVFDTHKGSLTSVKSPPIVFASVAAHTSIQKAAMLLGLGCDAVVSIPTDKYGRMDPQELEKQIVLSREQGKRPFCIVCTAGTTITGMIDPINAIHDIAKNHGLWMHVDAVYGGALIFSDRHRFLLQGIEKADSISFNPQKWLCITKTCAMFMLKDLSLLEKAFRIPAPYMSDHDEGPNLGEISIQGTRYPDVLKFWLSYQHVGKQGFASLVDEGMRLKELFVSEVQKRSDYLELAFKPDVNVICFRCKGTLHSGEDLNALNKSLQQYLLYKERIFLSLPNLQGQIWLKAVLINPYLDDSYILRLFAQVDLFCLSGQDTLRIEIPI